MSFLFFQMRGPAGHSGSCPHAGRVRTGIARLFHGAFCGTLLLLGVGMALADPDATVRFDTRDRGEDKGIGLWGEDATWVNMWNAKATAKNAAGLVDFVRISFYLSEPYEKDGSLSPKQIERIDGALGFVDVIDERMPVMLSPGNMEGIIDWYKEPDGGANIERWYHVMVKTREYVESKGHKVIAIEVFNEPDWKKWNMGTEKDLDELSRMCKDWGVLRVGPSTLSPGPAEAWYAKSKRNLDCGATHTLGGSMEQYLDFIKTVTRGRKPFMNPEVHSLVEVMVGIEAGLTYVCWWDQINAARAAFMRACKGKRIAYECVAKNWSAACVYRGEDGVLHGFAGTNERDNGKVTRYQFVCENEDVTYCLDGNEKAGVFREKGAPFEIQVKEEAGSKAHMTKWFTILPGKLR